MSLPPAQTAKPDARRAAPRGSRPSGCFRMRRNRQARQKTGGIPGHGTDISSDNPTYRKKVEAQDDNCEHSGNGSRIHDHFPENDRRPSSGGCGPAAAGVQSLSQQAEGRGGAQRSGANMPVFPDHVPKVTGWQPTGCGRRSV